MKTVLLPLLDDDSDTAELLSEAALATAHLIAERFTSHIEGFFVRDLPLQGATSLDVIPEYFAQHGEYWDRARQKTHNHFVAYMARHDIPVQGMNAPAEGITAHWTDADGDRPNAVGTFGRLFDVIVIPRAVSDTAESNLPTCEGALFESGRPVMLAPPATPKSIGRNVVIAWNGSLETARTIGLGMPFLQRAEVVTVLSVQGARGGMVPGPTGEQVAAQLVRHGLNATARTVAAHGRSSGVTVLEETAALGADLLFKGAYSHHRLREIIFGGTTRHVLHEAKLPVLIAH